MDININFLVTNSVNFFKDRILISLTDQQKKIALIAAAAFSALTLLYLFSKCKIFKKDNPTEIQNLPQKIEEPQMGAKKEEVEVEPKSDDALAGQPKVEKPQVEAKKEEKDESQKAEELLRDVSPALPTTPLIQDQTPAQPIKHDLEIEAENDPVKKQILEDYTLPMVEALGGFAKFMSFPKMENWKGNIDPKDLTATVMVGKHAVNGAEVPFLLFCYIRKEENGRYHVKGEYLGRYADGWQMAYASESEVNLRSVVALKEGSLGEKYMLDRVKRLMNNAAVGRMKLYPGVVLLKPAGDKEAFRPLDAYLQGEELELYMDLETIFYERKPEEGTTDLFLWDPKKAKEEQGNLIKKLFPNQKR